MSRHASFFAAIVGATVIALGLSACGGDNFKEKTLKFTERDTNNFGFNDAPPTAKVGREGPNKLTPSDVISFAGDLLDSSKKKVGEINADCIAVRPGTFETAKAQCVGTATVPGGTLSLNVGGKFGGKVTSGAITGGTGDYKGAGGTFESVGTGGPGSKDTYNVQIPQK
jgi:hypothetical protein